MDGKSGENQKGGGRQRGHKINKSYRENGRQIESCLDRQEGRWRLKGYITTDLQLTSEGAPKIDREENRSKGTLAAIPMPHECLITTREER